jgi:phosphatidylglycerol:prolipoprotein diacylglycerol transferase
LRLQKDAENVSKKWQRKRTVCAFFQLLIMSLILYRVLLLLNHTFADWFTEGNGNYYGNLTAWLIVMTLFPIIFKVSPLKTMDLLSPGLPICLFVAKFACFFHGCCSGFEMPNSWYFNQKNGRFEFPVQLIEALVAVALYIFLRRYIKRNKVPGSLFPVYLILYAASRFLTEWLRADLPNVLGPFDAYQIMSIVYVFIGAGILRLVWLRHRRDSCGSEEAASICR